MTGLDHITTEYNGEEEIDNIEVVSDGGYFIQPMYTKEFNADNWQKFIKNVKSLVRSSLEYKHWVGLVKHEQGLRNCAFLGRIDDDDAKVEIHHAIFTIHDVIEIIADHLIKEQPLTTPLLCHEVIRAHINNLVMVVPLSETIHELVHAGKINISIEQVYGNPLKFFKMFKNGITQEHINKLRLAIELSKRKLHKDDLLEIKELKNEIENDEDSINKDDIIGFLSDRAKPVTKEKKVISKKKEDTALPF